MIIHTAMSTEWRSEPSVLQQHTFSSLSINTVPTPSCSACVHSSLNKQSEEMEQQQSADKALHQYCDSGWVKGVSHWISWEKWQSTIHSETLLPWQNSVVGREHSSAAVKTAAKTASQPAAIQLSQDSWGNRRDRERKLKASKQANVIYHCAIDVTSWEAPPPFCEAFYQTALIVQQKPQRDV